MKSKIRMQERIKSTLKDPIAVGIVSIVIFLYIGNGTARGIVNRIVGTLVVYKGAVVSARCVGKLTS